MQDLCSAKDRLLGPASLEGEDHADRRGSFHQQLDLTEFRCLPRRSTIGTAAGSHFLPPDRSVLLANSTI